MRLPVSTAPVVTGEDEASRARRTATVRLVDQLAPGIHRITVPLPMKPGHVHCYAIEGDSGWLLVDTGIGLPDIRESWELELAQLPGQVTAIFVTHFHPDHVGAAAELHSLIGAPVFQGALDYAQCELVWDNPNWAERTTEWFVRHGAPAGFVDDLVDQGRLYREIVRFQRDPQLVEPGEKVGGWTTVAAPGHADGQLCLLQDGVLIAADHILDPISPTVGLWPASRPDPLGDYLTALETTIALDPSVAYPGHGDPIHRPAERARQLLAHHDERLAATQAALSSDPRSGFTLSHALFGRDLSPGARRFAIAETLSHLERLVRSGSAERQETVTTVTYTQR